MKREFEIRQLTPEEREREVEPTPYRAEREITINRQLIQEHELNGQLFVFVNGARFYGDYLAAIAMCAQQRRSL
jgi:hypothetical protein